MNKLGLYINNLMSTIQNTDEKPFVRELALERLKIINNDISSFIFNYIDEIEELPEFEEDTSDGTLDLWHMWRTYTWGGLWLFVRHRPFRLCVGKRKQWRKSNEIGVQRWMKNN